MSDFDIAASVDQAAMDTASANIYQNIYPKLFKGSKSAGPGTITWDIQQSPTFDLTNVDDFHAKVTAHLQRHKVSGVGSMSQAEVADALHDMLAPSSFKLNFPKVSLSDGSTPVDAAVGIDCTITTDGGVLKLVAQTAAFTTPGPAWDKLAITAILAEMVAIANSMLSGVDIPQIQFQGISLTAPTVSIQNGRVVVFFNLAGKSQPAPAQLAWPSNSFFLLMSDDAKNAVGAAATGGLNKTMSKSGSVGSSIGGASYHANATISGVTVSSAGPGSPDFHFNSKVSGGVGANVKFLCVPVGVDYNLSAAPNPSGIIAIGLNGTALSATTKSVNPFIIAISPSGSIIEKIISAITTPILDSISVVFSPMISAFLGGISFDIATLPNVSISIDGYAITLTPSGMSLTSSNGYLAAVGDLKIA